MKKHMEKLSGNLNSGQGWSKLTMGQRICLLRRQRNWSQEELAWWSEISREQISRIERNASIPALKTLRKLESVFGVEICDRSVDSEKTEYAEKGKPFQEIARFEKELAKLDVKKEELRRIFDFALKTASESAEKSDILRHP